MTDRESAINWVKRQNWYPKFVRNCKEGDYVCGSVDVYMEEISNPASIIEDAFCWEDTPEGYDYWYEISSDLCDMMP